jgi:hypothetical protein
MRVSRAEGIGQWSKTISLPVKSRAVTSTVANSIGFHMKRGETAGQIAAPITPLPRTTEPSGVDRLPSDTVEIVGW